MTVNLDIVARINTLEMEELLIFAEGRFEKYGISEEEPFHLQSLDACKLMADFRISKTRECKICLNHVRLSERNPNLFDGFHDGALNLFVCNMCRSNPAYIKLKSPEETVSTSAALEQLQIQDPGTKVSAQL